MEKALVLDGHIKSALCAVRALGEKGVSVIAGSERPTAMSLHSKYAEETLVYPSPETDPGAFLRSVSELGEKYKTETGKPLIVYTFSDATTSILFQHYNELKDVILMMFPSPGSFARAYNKKETLELAESMDIPVTPLYEYSKRHEYEYPLVIKPRRSVVWREGVACGGTAEFVFSPDELHVRYVDLEGRLGEPPIIQPLIKGGEYGVEMLVADGEILQTFCHKRVRSLSPTGGAAVVKKTATQVELVAKLEQYATRLVKNLNWSGPIMVEFKYDREDKLPRLMEINGRFWGSLPLAERAGVDFVGSYYDWLSSGTLSSASSTTAEICRTRHFLGDLKWLLSVWFKRDRMRAHLYPSRFSATISFVLEMFRSSGDVFSAADLQPSYYEIIDIIKR